MRKSTVIKKIEKQFQILKEEYGITGVSTENDLKTNIMVNEQTITHIHKDDVSTTTFDGEEEIDWNDIDLINLSNDTLHEILIHLEDFVTEQDKLIVKTRSYNF